MAPPDTIAHCLHLPGNYSHWQCYTRISNFWCWNAFSSPPITPYMVSAYHLMTGTVTRTIKNTFPKKKYPNELADSLLICWIIPHDPKRTLILVTCFCWPPADIQWGNAKLQHILWIEITKFIAFSVNYAAIILKYAAEKARDYNNISLVFPKFIGDGKRVYDIKICNDRNQSIDFLDQLTHLPLVPHICVSESGQHWFKWLGAYSVKF